MQIQSRLICRNVGIFFFSLNLDRCFALLGAVWKEEKREDFALALGGVSLSYF